MNPTEPLPYVSLIAPNLLATKSRASSQDDSTKAPFLRIKGFVIRSSELTKSQPNFPLTHVEIALTGASETGWIFKISRPFVHTSKEQPTPQNVHTVFVFSFLFHALPLQLQKWQKCCCTPVQHF